jgi:hypothetical protein
MGASQAEIDAKKHTVEKMAHGSVTGKIFHAQWRNGIGKRLL